MTDYTPTTHEESNVPTETVYIESQPTQNNCTKFMFLITISAIIASIIITYLLTRRSL